MVIALSEKPQGRHVFTELELESNILGIRDLADIQCGIRENAEFLDGIRELTTTRATGFSEISERDVVLGKNGTQGRDDRSWGCWIDVNVASGTPFLDPASGFSHGGRRSEAPLSKISPPPLPKDQLKEGLES